MSHLRGGCDTDARSVLGDSDSQQVDPLEKVEKYSAHKTPVERSDEVEQQQSKRRGYLSWDDYFLSVAVLSSKRSKDPTTASGACIVDKLNRIVGIGYSGFPRGCPDSIFPWSDEGKDWLHTKSPYICHSVSNAILNKCTSDVRGARIYVMEYPDSESAKVIIQSGIEEVIIMGADPGKSGTEDDESNDVKAGSILLDMAGITVRCCNPALPSLTLDFVSKTHPTGHVSSEEIARSPFDTDTSEQCLLQELIARDVLWKEARYDPVDAADNCKANSHLSWQDYFMAMAFLAAQRSKDPNTQVGACIVDNENKIISCGYNGFPSGCSDDQLPWARSNADELLNKYLYVCHAEVNAILNKGSADVKGSTIYVALFPCQNCAKMIIQSGIREVVFMSDAYRDTPGCRASRIMFRCAGVKLRQYIPSIPHLVLNLRPK